MLYWSRVEDPRGRTEGREPERIAEFGVRGMRAHSDGHPALEFPTIAALPRALRRQMGARRTGHPSYKLPNFRPQNFLFPPNSCTPGNLGGCAAIALRSAMVYASAVTMFRDKQKMKGIDTSLVRVARTCCGAWLVFSRGRRQDFRDGYVTRALDALGPFFPSRPSRSWCPSLKCRASASGSLLPLCFGRRAPARAVSPSAHDSCFQESRNARRYD